MWKRIKLIKSRGELLESVLIVGFALLCNSIAYYGARLIASSWYHHDMTTQVDEMIPYMPWTVSIYWGCYLFWGINYCLCALQDRAARNRFFCADILSRCVCLAFFLLLPTTNIRPEVADGGVWNFLMRLLYSVDSADNLFPSIHCLVSWLCWIGVRNRKDVSVVYRYFSLFAAVVICISTLTTKQHVIVDVIGGVVLAEVCYLVAGIPAIHAFFSKIMAKLFGLLRFKRKTKS